MPKTIDPILLLREYFQQNKKIEKQGNYLKFSDDIKLKIDTPTAFVQSQSSKQYSIGSLWFYLKHRKDPLAVYKKEILKERIETVVGLDKGNNKIN
jgi:hypothetical protein